jgi:uncharacterized protein
MSHKNAAIIQSIDRAFADGDIATVMGQLSADIVWNEAENHPYSDRKPDVGPDAVVKGIFARLRGDWDGFGVIVEEILAAEDLVVALGRYHGSYKSTGHKQNSQMVHVWRVEGGKATRFQQYTDTLQIARVMGVI